MGASLTTMAFALRVLVVAVALVALTTSNDAADNVVPEQSYYDSLTELYDQEISLIQKGEVAKAKAAAKAAKDSAKVEAKWTKAEAAAGKKAHALNKKQRALAIKAAARS